MLNREYLQAVSLDCSGAFDCIKFDSAKKSMSRKGVPNNINRWYKNLLAGMVVTAEMQGCKASILPARGSPQGGVLSPLIWNLIMDTFLSRFKKGPLKVIGYADYILLYIKGGDPHTMINLLQPRLHDAITWGLENGLVFNPPQKKYGVICQKEEGDRDPASHDWRGGSGVEHLIQISGGRYSPEPLLG